VSTRNKILGGIAALTLACGAGVGVSVAAPPVHAATAACGPSCVALASQQWGMADVSAVLLGTGQVGQSVILSPAGRYPSEDFRLLYEGTVAMFYQDGLVDAAVGLTWPSDPVYEYEYVPNGTETDLCLGTAVTAANGTPVTLQRCGTTSKVIWIPLSIDRIGGYVPLINGSDTVSSTPYVLTAGKVGQDLSTAELYLVAGTFAPLQMWENLVGVR